MGILYVEHLFLTEWIKVDAQKFSLHYAKEQLYSDSLYITRKNAGWLDKHNDKQRQYLNRLTKDRQWTTNK